ncbi:MAG TPA: hypothetical protein PKX30_01500 [Candidatus Pacearchaeota archaeon]|nr:hypothetical protein [Candidatus Pacearchaeota archaeon]
MKRICCIVIVAFLLLSPMGIGAYAENDCECGEFSIAAGKPVANNELSNTRVEFFFDVTAKNLKLSDPGKTKIELTIKLDGDAGRYMPKLVTKLKEGREVYKFSHTLAVSQLRKTPTVRASAALVVEDKVICETKVAQASVKIAEPKITLGNVGIIKLKEKFKYAANFEIAPDAKVENLKFNFSLYMTLPRKEGEKEIQTIKLLEKQTFNVSDLPDPALFEKDFEFPAEYNNIKGRSINSIITVYDISPVEEGVIPYREGIFMSMMTR